jgi:hypothetical protein
MDPGVSLRSSGMTRGRIEPENPTRVLHYGARDAGLPLQAIAERGRRHARGRLPRLPDLPLRRRSRRADAERAGEPGAARRIARPARPRQGLRTAIRDLRRQCGARRFRHLLPQPAGRLHADRGALPGDLRARAGRDFPVARGRHSPRRLHRDQARQPDRQVLQFISVLGVSCRASRSASCSSCCSR